MNTSPKGFPAMAALPKKIPSIVISVGGLATFLIFGSFILISYPIAGSLNFNRLVKSISAPPNLLSLNNTHSNILSSPPPTQSSQLHPSSQQGDLDDSKPDYSKEQQNEVDSKPETSKEQTSQQEDVIDSKPETSKEQTSQQEDVIDSKPESPPKESSEQQTSQQDTIDSKPESPTETVNSTLETLLPKSQDTTTSSEDVSGSCDLYHGNWIYDSSGPLYTNNTCPLITQMQNCQGNGRPDSDYENWRWKPSQCDLPRFDGKKFLELMRGKTLAFIGDSVARNQMESMMCILWQVEVPKNRGYRKMQRWYFKSTSTMIVRIWSSWLVHRTSEAFDYAPDGVDKLFLDAPDEIFMEFIPKFDVVVLSSGHWFAKQSVYILNNEIVGGQLWWPDKSRPKKINNIEAFGISVETILTSMATHPNYTGLTILRSFSPDHYEGGAWNTGGSCTGKVKPADELVPNGFTDIMHEKQVAGFNKATKKATNRSKLRLMDITEVFAYRHDGHPGPYRSRDPNKITKRGPNGQPPPQDCLHWCMPGAVDTWNELVLEIIRREYEGKATFPA